MSYYPYLLFDREKGSENLERMLSRVRSGPEFRPHFKTHQSRETGRLFREAGIDGITVSSVVMAEYFAEDNWSDITIAFPVSILEVKRIDELTSRINLNILVSDEFTVEQFSEHLTHELGIYIELDPGYGRSGVPIDEHMRIDKIIRIIERAAFLTFKGFYLHAGHTYRSRTKREILQTTAPILYQLNILKSVFPAPVCFGDTPSCSILEDFGPIDQVSPGNFIFYDWMQYKIGSCEPEQIAIAMMCPVVAKYANRNQLLIHGGAVHFSKESFTEQGETYFGIVAECAESGWGNPLTDNKLISISQEHGTIRCSDDYFNSVEVGDVIPILPIHSCLTADCMGSYTDLSGRNYDHLKKSI